MIYIIINGDYLIVMYSQVCANRIGDLQQVRNLKGYRSERLASYDSHSGIKFLLLCLEMYMNVLFMY